MNSSEIEELMEQTYFSILLVEFFLTYNRKGDIEYIIHKIEKFISLNSTNLKQGSIVEFNIIKKELLNQL